MSGWYREEALPSSVVVADYDGGVQRFGPFIFAIDRLFGWSKIKKEDSSASPQEAIPLTRPATCAGRSAPSGTSFLNLLASSFL